MARETLNCPTGTVVDCDRTVGGRGRECRRVSPLATQRGASILSAHSRHWSAEPGRNAAERLEHAAPRHWPRAVRASFCMLVRHENSLAFSSRGRASMRIRVALNAERRATRIYELVSLCSLFSFIFFLSFFLPFFLSRIARASRIRFITQKLDKKGDTRVARESPLLHL